MKKAPFFLVLPTQRFVSTAFRHKSARRARGYLECGRRRAARHVISPARLHPSRSRRRAARPALQRARFGRRRRVGVAPGRPRDRERSRASRGSAARPRSALRPRNLGRVAASRGSPRRARAMATVEQYLAVLAGAQAAQNAEAQRAAAQMQIEVRRADPRLGTSAPRNPRGPASAPVDPPSPNAKNPAPPVARTAPRARQIHIGAGVSRSRPPSPPRARASPPPSTTPRLAPP